MQLTSKQLETLRDLINIGVGRGADVLNTLLQVPISLEVLDVNCLTSEEFPRELGEADKQLCIVVMPFNGPLEGDSVLVLPGTSAEELVSIITGKETRPGLIDTLEAGTLSEIGNIVLNGVMGTISNNLGLSLIYQVPGFRQGELNLVHSPDSGREFASVLAQTRFQVDGLTVEGFIVLLLKESSLARTLERCDALLREEV